MKQNFKSDEVEDRQEWIKQTGNWLKADVGRKFRKQLGTGGTGKKLNMGRRSLTAGPKEGTREEQRNAEQP